MGDNVVIGIQEWSPPSGSIDSMGARFSLSTYLHWFLWSEYDIHFISLQTYLFVAGFWQANIYKTSARWVKGQRWKVGIRAYLQLPKALFGNFGFKSQQFQFDPIWNRRHLKLKWRKICSLVTSVTHFGTDRNLLHCPCEQAGRCAQHQGPSVQVMTSIYFGLVLNDRTLYIYIFIITLTLLTPQPEKFLVLCLKTSLTVLRTMSSLPKATGKRLVMVISNSDLCTWNCVTWNLSAAEQQLKFQFWSNLKLNDFKFKRWNLAGSDLKLKLPNGALVGAV